MNSIVTATDRKSMTWIEERGPIFHPVFIVMLVYNVLCCWHETKQRNEINIEVFGAWTRTDNFFYKLANMEDISFRVCMQVTEQPLKEYCVLILQRH